MVKDTLWKKNKNILLTFGIIIMMLKWLIHISNFIEIPEIFNDVINIIYFFCTIPKIISTPKNKIIMWSIILLTMITFILSKNVNLLITFLTIGAVDNDGINKYITMLLKISLWYLIIHIILSIVYYCIGNTDILTLTHTRGVRWSLGLKHPNSLAIMSFNMILMYVWLVWDNIKRKNIIIIIFVTIITYTLTLSKTSMFASIFLIILIYCQKNNIIFSYWRKIFLYLFPVISILAMISVILYPFQNSIIEIADKLLNKRIWIGWTWYENNGFTLIGQNVKTEHFSNILFDSIYTQFLINLGFIWIIIISALLFMVAKIGEDKDIFILTFFIIYGVTEVMMLNIYYFIALIALIPILEKIEILKKYEVKITDIITRLKI